MPHERLVAGWLRERFAAPPDWFPETADESRATKPHPTPASVLVPLYVAFAPNRQRKLIIRHNHDGRTTRVNILIQINACHAGRAKSFGDERTGIIAPFDHIDLLIVKFIHNVLNAVAALADAFDRA